MSDWELRFARLPKRVLSLYQGRPREREDPRRYKWIWWHYYESQWLGLGAGDGYTIRRAIPQSLALLEVAGRYLDLACEEQEEAGGQ